MRLASIRLSDGKKIKRTDRLSSVVRKVAIVSIEVLKACFARQRVLRACPQTISFHSLDDVQRRKKVTYGPIERLRREREQRYDKGSQVRAPWRVNR